MLVLLVLIYLVCFQRVFKYLSPIRSPRKCSHVYIVHSEHMPNLNLKKEAHELTNVSMLIHASMAWAHGLGFGFFFFFFGPCAVYAGMEH